MPYIVLLGARGVKRSAITSLAGGPARSARLSKLAPRHRSACPCDWTSWDGDEPLAWNEIVSVAEAGEDRYSSEGRAYEALDHYCVAPGCDCDEAHVHFYG